MYHKYHRSVLSVTISAQSPSLSSLRIQAMGEPSEEQPIDCPDCEMLLSGLDQWSTHLVGKKHTRRAEKTLRRVNMEQWARSTIESRARRHMGTSWRSTRFWLRASAGRASRCLLREDIGTPNDGGPRCHVGHGWAHGLDSILNHKGLKELSS